MENPEKNEPNSGSAAAPGETDLRTRWIIWGALFLVAVLSLAYLVIAPSPWSDGVDVSEEVKESIRTRSWVIIGLWTGAAINLCLAILALLAWNFRPRMIDRAPFFGDRDTGNFTTGSDRWRNWLLISLATIVSAWTMVPRLDLGLWGDEDATARRFLLGHVYRLDDDKFVIKEPSWLKTIWNYDTGPNNHTLFNVLSRLSHGPADTSGSDPGHFYFSERKIRLPSFIATLVMIPSAAWLVSLIGFPRGAPLTAFLLALHPWIVRHGSDARGYALQMLFEVLAAVFLVQALRHRHRAIWWLGFGCAEFLSLAAHLSSIYFLVPLNIAALWLCWEPFRKGHGNPFRVANFWRYWAATLTGAMLTIQFMMPQALQLPGYLKHGRFEGKPAFSDIQDWLAHWAVGTPWHEWQPANPYSLSWNDLFDSKPVLLIAITVILVALLLAGVALLARRRNDRWWLLPLLSPALLLFADAFRSEKLVYPWYTVGYLPFAFVVIGAGLGATTILTKRWRPGLARAVPAVFGLLIILLFSLVTQPQRQLYRQYPVEPTANAVRLARTVVNPFHPRIDEVLTLGFVHASRLYDPAMILADNDEEFFDALREADRLQKPISVNAANLGLGPIFYPRAMKLIEDREVFEEPEVIHGLQLPCTRYVFRYRPGGLARYEARQSGPQ